MKAVNRRPVSIRLGMLASLMLTLALASVAAMPALAQESLAAAPASPIYKANPMGNLLLVGPISGSSIASNPSGWSDVPGLSGVVYSRSGDNLEITVTAEMSGPGTVQLRTLVDGTVAAPDDVAYKLAGDVFDGVRSFTFVAQNVSNGSHLVQIQWFAQRAASKIPLGKLRLTSAQGYRAAADLVV